MTTLEDRVRKFIRDDVDEAGKAELASLLNRSASGDEASRRDLEDRFLGPLSFGTAGLRGLVGPGENRMNRAVVIRATAGLVEHLAATVPGSASRGIVVGRDARRGSVEFQRDAAEVAMARGFTVHWIDGPSPTPLSAYGVKTLGAAAGIVVTASHNPPEYNGYKVYWGNGAQIVPPQDEGIARAIEAAPGASSVPRLPLEEGRARGLLKDASDLRHRYLGELSRRALAKDAPVAKLSIAYSALHGVGASMALEALRNRGFERVHSVPEQEAPDGRFPTVRFPNPEEAGAMDLVLALAKDRRADLVLVNDPDADRLGAAVYDPRTSGFVVLSGNEIGALLASHLARHDLEGGDSRLLMTTIVSSKLLKKMAADLGLAYAETLTGFKWIANEAMRREAERKERFLFGYEEALGYTAGDLVRDKDGIGSALFLAEAAAVASAEGRTLVDELELIYRRHGFFASRQKSVTLPGAEGAGRIKAAMSALRSSCFEAVGGRRVVSARDLSRESSASMRSDVLLFELDDGGQVAVRPSGTEPKIKLYFEIAEPLSEQDTLEHAKARAAKVLVEIETAFLSAASLHS